MAIEGLFYYLLFWFKKVQGYRLHFGRLPSAGSLRQAPFDRLRASQPRQTGGRKMFLIVQAATQEFSAVFVQIFCFIDRESLN
jgi:hypothetical protein